MRLDTCLVADAATSTPDGKLFIHGGGITRLTPPQLPWMHPMLALVLRFQIEAHDGDGAHEIGLRVMAPDGTEMLTPSPSMQVSLGRLRSVEGEESYLQAVMQIAGLPLGAAGILTLQVTLDGETVRSLPLAVIAPSTGT